MAFASRVFSHNEGNVYEQEYRLGCQDIDEPDEYDSNGYEEASRPLLTRIKGGGWRKDAWTVSLTLFHVLLLAFGVFYIQAGSKGIQNAQGTGESRTTSESQSSVWGWTAVGSGEGSVVVTYWLCVTAVLLGFLMALLCLMTFFALYRWNSGYPSFLKAVHGFTLFFLLFFVIFGMTVVGYWDDNSAVTSENTIATTTNQNDSLLLSNPFHGPTKFWMITLTILTTLLILINLLTYLGISDEDLYIQKPTLKFSSLILLIAGVTIVALLSYAIVTHSAISSSPSEVTSSNVASPSSTSSAENSTASTSNTATDENEIELLPSAIELSTTTTTNFPSFFASSLSPLSNPFSALTTGAGLSTNLPYNWTIYCTLGTACGILLCGLTGLIIRASYYWILMILMPLIGGVCVVAASINFYQETPSQVVAIADLIAIGVQVFLLLMFISLWVMRKFHNDHVIEGYHQLLYEVDRRRAPFKE